MRNEDSHLHVTDHDTERNLIEAAQHDPSRTPNHEEAEDVTAEVFQQALAGIVNFEWQGTPFVAWLLGIASHLIAHRWQRHARYPETPADELEEPGALDQTERQALLAQLVDRLPEDQRHVIRRRFIDQHSIREIACELGRSEGAIKQLQFRAIENLRDQMRSRHA